MAIERGMPDYHVLRPALDELVFGSGLNRDEMLNQSAWLREPENRQIMSLLPPSFCFPDAGSVLSYFEQMEQEGRYTLANLPPPEGYPPVSPTGETVSFHPTPLYPTPPNVAAGSRSGNPNPEQRSAK